MTPAWRICDVRPVLLIWFDPTRPSSLAQETGGLFLRGSRYTRNPFRVRYTRSAPTC